MDRRMFLALSAAFGGLGVTGASAADEGKGTPFSRATLRALAESLSRAPMVPRAKVPQAWQDLTYDEYRLFWFDENKALWEHTALNARADFFLPGLFFPSPIAVNVVEDGIARPVPFDFSHFSRTDKAPKLTVDDSVGYSGFRLRGELAQPGVFQEFAVFQGASYFRAHGRDQVYGLSARGLALNTGDVAGEEFPDFTTFWLETPAPGNRNLTVHALLDSPSVTGAYTFALHPGPVTEMRVQATLFPRVPLTHVGLGPLTSMFLFDGTNRNRFDDFRPQVHDSDGLLIHNGAGEVLWRALANPRAVQTSSFVDDNPRGFGLMQRARSFGEFNDLEANYHQRPSIWVEPGEGWGQGAVTLVEIPSDKEYYDNIVAYWRPRAPLPAGAPHEMTYTLEWGGDVAPSSGMAPVLNSAIGRRVFGEGIVVVVDFADHAALPKDLSTLTLHTSSNTGPLEGAQVQRNPETGGARLTFVFDPLQSREVELRAQLLRGTLPVSEVWLYRWTA